MAEAESVTFEKYLDGSIRDHFLFHSHFHLHLQFFLQLPSEPVFKHDLLPSIIKEPYLTLKGIDN